MKKIIIVGGIAALVYYFYFYNKGVPSPSSIPSPSANTTGSAALNLGTATARRNFGNAINLGSPAYANKVPGIASVS